MAQPKFKEVPVDEIPEVIEFLDAQVRLEEFKARHPDLLNELEDLVEDYNQKLQAAEKVVRGKEVNCGPFTQLTPAITYDAERLYNAIGREEFIRLGGIIRQVPEYVIDGKTVEAAILGRRIPKEVAEVVKKTTRKYTVIKKAVIP